MKQLIAIAALSLVVVFSGFAQSKDLKGPKFKNAKPSEKYDGNSSILIKEDPYQFQGPERKNFNPRNYEMEVTDTPAIKLPDIELVVSNDNRISVSDDQKEKIIYKRIDIKDMKGKNAQGLKGPAYKNYKP